MKEEKKKLTNGQLLRRLTNATLHLDRTKDTKTVYFSDKGLGLTYDDNEGYAIVTTNFHQHVFKKITSQGISRPYLYIMRFVNIALENNCMIRDDNGNFHYSYAKLFSSLKEKDDKSEYNVCWFIDLWLFNIFANLYSIDETEIGAWLVYETYMHALAQKQCLLEEHTSDVTNKQFTTKVIGLLNDFLKDADEHVVLKKETDEEKMEKQVSALNEQMLNETEKGVLNNGGNE